MSFNIKKMINFAYLCNYLFCMVTSYFQPFVYPLVDLSSRFSIPKMTFLAKCFTLPFKHPHLSFSIKYVYIIFHQNSEYPFVRWSITHKCNQCMYSIDCYPFVMNLLIYSLFKHFINRNSLF